MDMGCENELTELLEISNRHCCGSCHEEYEIGSGDLCSVYVDGIEYQCCCGIATEAERLMRISGSKFTNTSPLIISESHDIRSLYGLPPKNAEVALQAMDPKDREILKECFEDNKTAFEYLADR